MLNKGQSEIIHVELTFSLDRNRYLLAPTHFPVMPMSKWWDDWIKSQYSSNPVELASNLLLTRYLDAHYGPDILILLSRGLEIIKSEAGSLMWGSFGVRGPLETIAEILDILPNAHLVSPKTQTPQVITNGQHNPNAKP